MHSWVCMWLKWDAYTKRYEQQTNDWLSDLIYQSKWGTTLAMPLKIKLLRLLNLIKGSPKQSGLWVASVVWPTTKLASLFLSDLYYGFALKKVSLLFWNLCSIVFYLNKRPGVWKHLAQTLAITTCPCSWLDVITAPLKHYPAESKLPLLMSSWALCLSSQYIGPYLT